MQDPLGDSHTGREEDNHCVGSSEHPVAILLAGMTRATRQSLWSKQIDAAMRERLQRGKMTEIVLLKLLISAIMLVL
jgi:hypothetical protein